MINRGLFNSICLPCPARSKQWLSWLSCSVCECGLSDAISVSRYLHNVLQTKWLTLDAYDCCNWHPLYPGTHSNDDNDGHLFRGRIHPGVCLGLVCAAQCAPGLWPSDHTSVFCLQSSFVSQGLSGSWHIRLRERSDVESVVGILPSVWEHASLLSSLAAAQPCDGRWLFCHNLPVFPHHYHTRLLLIWDNPALARHYQFSAKVHRILRYSRPQVVLISLKMFSF